MFGCSETVTFWHKRFNADTKKDEYIRVVLPVQCKWRTRENRASTGSGSITKRYATVIIPYNADYPFNGKIGDYMALGSCHTEITGEKPYTVDEVKRLSPDFMQIENIKDNTYSPFGRRYKIEGVV